MDTIADRLKAVKKTVKGDDLTPQKFVPKDGQVVQAEYVHREVLTIKGGTSHIEIVTFRTDQGLFNTMVNQGTFNLGEKPPVKGDLMEILFRAEPNPTPGKDPFMRANITLYHVGTGDPIPF